MTPQITMGWSGKQIRKWCEVKQKKAKVVGSEVSSVSITKHRWQAPPARTMKMNVDASVFKGASSFSLGVVLRGDRGVFIRGRTIMSVVQAQYLKLKLVECLRLCRGLLQRFINL